MTTVEGEEYFEGATRPDDDPRLIRWERVMNPVIIVAALAPIVVGLAPRTRNDPFGLLNMVSWAVFMADLIVHMRFRKGYLRTGLGKFDLVIVILTFPWYLIPALSNSAFLGLARLARLARLALAGGTTGVIRRFAARLGKAGLYSGVLIILCSEVVYRVEPKSAGFDTQWVSIWWGFVTFTTVGYGDLVPTTTTGRFTSVVLMLGGIALIGLLAGSLAELISETDSGAVAADPSVVTDDGSTDAATLAMPTPTAGTDAVLAELQALRSELAELRQLVAADKPDP